MKKNSLLKYMVFSAIAFLLIICFIKRNNVIRWIDAGLTIKRQKRQIERYQEDIRKLDGQIESISTDIDTLERYARENFYFAEPGEDVFIVDE